MTLSDIAIRRPVFTIVLQLLLIVLGLMSLRSLGTDLFPDVSFPVVTVTTVYPGASPSEVEAQVTRKLEDAVAGIADLDTVRSSSRESVSVVIVMFKMSADIDKAAQDVRDRIGAVRSNLPRDARDPTVRRIDVGAAPVLTYVAEGKGMSRAEVRRITEQVLKPQLERVNGVAAVEVVGGQDREVQVEVDRSKLEALNLPLTQVIDRLRMENLALPAGHFQSDGKEVSVKLDGDVDSAAQVGDLVVATTPAGTQVRLSEVARVVDGFQEARTEIRANGRSAVSFEVIKQSGTNTLQIVEAVKKKLEDTKPLLPKNFRTSILVDQSTFIEENAHEVEIAIVYGGAMAILVILLFMLDLRSTFISALALPTSVIGTFFIMSLLGFTLNMMTLLALSLAIGLLIDDAVVVRENIFRHLELGEDPFTAASKGTSEIALAVLATTLTIVAVFLPVAFMSGVVGQFFRSFGLTISAATLLSLFVAFTLDPMLSARLAVAVDHSKRRNVVVRFFEAMHQAVEEAYAVVLAVSVRHRLLTVSFAALVFFGSTKLAGLMGNEFVAPEDRNQFLVDVELPSGTNLQQTSEALLAAELAMTKHPQVVTVYNKLGPNTEVNKAAMRIVTTDKRAREETIWQIQEDVRAILQKVPNAKITILPPAFVEGLPSDVPLQVKVRGSDLALLERDAAAVEAMLRAIPGVGDLQVAYAPGKPERAVEVDRRKAADLGLPVALAGRTLRAALEGEEVGNLRLDAGASKEVKIRVRLQESDRSDMDALLRLQVPVPPRLVMTAQGPIQMGGFIPLGAIASVRPEASPQVIDRQDRTRQIAVTAVPKGRSLGEIVAELEPKLEAYRFGGDGYYRLDGQVKQMKESGESFALAGLLAIIFIFLILASQFESFIHPLTIMVSLPLAMIGAWLGLFLSDNDLSMGSNIGVILLMGLVTKNGILLVDAALQLQREGIEATVAIVEAGRKRLRPILMTSAAMVLGMLPTAITDGPGSEFRAPMAIAVIGGVITSTFLTLLVLPSLFLWFDALRRLPGRLFRRRVAAPSLGGLPPTAPPPSTALLLALGATSALAAAAFTLGASSAYAAPEPDGPAATPSTSAGGPSAPPPAAMAVPSAPPAAASAPLPPAPPPPAPPPASVVGGAAAPGLALDDAIAAAQRANPDLAVARARLAEARSNQQRLRTAWLPDVKAIGQYTYNSVEASFDFTSMAKGMGAAFGLTLTDAQLANLPPPTVIQAHHQAAAVVQVDQTVFAMAPLVMADALRLGLQAQQVGLQAAQREIAFRVREIYYSHAGVQRLSEAARRALALADQRLAALRTRRKVGSDGDLPALRAEIERARAEQDLLRASLALEQMREIIGILTGGPAPDVLGAVPPVAELEGQVPEWQQQGVSSRPELTALRKGLDAQRMQIREAELRWLPIVTASGTWRWSNVQGFAGQNDLWMASLNLVVPVFDRGVWRAEANERRAALARMEAELHKAEHDVRVAIRQAALEVRNAREVVRIASLQTEVARKSAAIAGKTLALGVATSLEVAEADTGLRLAEASLERERLSLELAMLRLRHLVGGP